MDQKTETLCFLIGVVHYVKSWKCMKQNNNMTIRYKEKRSLTMRTVNEMDISLKICTGRECSLLPALLGLL